MIEEHTETFTTIRIRLPSGVFLEWRDSGSLSREDADYIVKLLIAGEAAITQRKEQK